MPVCWVLRLSFMSIIFLALGKCASDKSLSMWARSRQHAAGGANMMNRLVEAANIDERCDPADDKIL